MGLGGPYLPGRPHPGPLHRPPALGSQLYLDAQLVTQPAISQAEGEINFLVLHGRGGGGGVGRRWGAEAGIFPISDSSGLILSQARRKARKRVLQAKFHHRRQPQQREEAARGQTGGRSSSAGAERGSVGRQGGRQALHLARGRLGSPASWSWGVGMPRQESLGMGHVLWLLNPAWHLLHLAQLLEWNGLQRMLCERGAECLEE